jgi:hypothetical protein
MPRLSHWFLLMSLSACDAAKEEAPKAEDKCPKVGMDTLPGDWIRVEGSKADKTWRFRFLDDGGKPTLWLTNGGFAKKRLIGEKRTNDWKFTEVAADPAAVAAGTKELVRFYVEPMKKTCSLRISQGSVVQVDGKEKETIAPGFQDYLPVPEGAEFSYQPCDGTLFLNKAATDKAEADKELAAGGAVFQSSLGDALTVGAWSDVAADGDVACKYDMDLYFDDARSQDKDKKVRGAAPAGEPTNGFRPWTVTDWYAPWSGNHHFQMYRYRTCADGARTLIGVSCLEAILQ